MAFLSRIATGAIASLSLLTVAQADLKLVSQMHIDQGGTTRPDEMITTYYKGSVIRTDSGDLITLVDTKTGLTALAQPSTKTYREFNANQMAQGNPMFRNVSVDAHATVTPTTEHKTIAGKNATKFIADVDMTISSESNKGFSQHTTVHIVRWTTTDVSTGISPEVLAKYSPDQAAFQNLKGMEDVNKELAKIPGVPLSSEVTVKSEFSGPPGVGGIPAPTNEDIFTDVQTVDDSPLDDSLFQIPGNYKKMVAPGHLPSPGGGGA